MIRYLLKLWAAGIVGIVGGGAAVAWWQGEPIGWINLITLTVAVLIGTSIGGWIKSRKQKQQT